MRTPYKSKPPIQEAVFNYSPNLGLFAPPTAPPGALEKERPQGLLRRVRELLEDLGAELESAEMNAGKYTGPAIRQLAMKDLQMLVRRLDKLPKAGPK